MEYILSESAAAYPSERDSPKHQCQLRQDDRGLSDWLKAWWLFVLHPVITLLITLCCLRYINGQDFAVSSGGSNALTQPDVVRVLGYALRAQGIIATSCQTIVAWRSLFVAVEKSGLALGQLSTIISRTPVLSSNRYLIIIGLAITLTWPAQLASPLLTGSITWVPGVYSYPSVSATTSIAIASAKSDAWGWLQIYEETRQNLVQKAARFTLSISEAMELEVQAGNVMTSAVRLTTDLKGYPVGSIASGVKVPVFEVQEFTWVEQPRANLPQDLLHTMFRGTTLNFSSSDIPLLRSVPGTAALLKSTPWESQSTSSLPTALSVQGTRYAAVMVNRTSNGGDISDDFCTGAVKDTSGTLPTTFMAVAFIPNSQTNCYAIAKMSVSVGSALCSANGCQMFNSKVIGSTDGGYDIQSDELTGFVLDMLPEVMLETALLQMSNVSNWQSYLTNITIQAYQGAWSALVETLRSDSPAPITILPAEPATQALFSKYYVAIWFGLNCLLPIAGIVLLFAQSRCRAKTVTDPFLTAMLLDPTEIINSDVNGLCNATTVSSKEKRYKIRMRCAPKDTFEYHHNMLYLEHEGGVEGYEMSEQEV